MMPFGREHASRPAMHSMRRTPSVVSAGAALWNAPAHWTGAPPMSRQRGWRPQLLTDDRAESGERRVNGEFGERVPCQDLGKM